MGFQQGLSGLNAASKTLDVIGNNISNASTVGFKQGLAQFADVFANALNGSSAGAVGIGVKVSGVVQQFTQGNVTTTNNPLDIAINGGGFFRMSTNGAITYTRNGQFQMDKTGNIINAQNQQLTGFMASAGGVLSTGAPQPIKINTADAPPAQTTAINTVLNLDSRLNVPGTKTPVTVPPVITPTTFSPTDPTTFNSSTSVNVFDSLGNPHVVQTFFVKVNNNTAAGGTAPAATPAGIKQEWDIFVTVDGTQVNSTSATAPITTGSLGRMGFDNLGAIVDTKPNFNATETRALKLTVPVTTGAVTPINTTLDIKFDFTGCTQYGSDFSVSKNLQDGYTSGKLSKFNIGKDGTILGTYTNGKTAVLAQVVLANFTNPNGLQSAGDNQWLETATSGSALVGPPNSGSLGTLTSSATEDSNTDLTGELVNMITAQRVYQANAQTIKTQDQVLQTLVNLR